MSNEEPAKISDESLGNQLNDIDDGKLHINGVTYLIYGEKATANGVNLLLLTLDGRRELTYEVDAAVALKLIADRSAIITSEKQPKPYRPASLSPSP